MSHNATQNIHLDGEPKTGTSNNQRGYTKPQRLTKKELRDYWSKKITELHIEDQERKRNQVI